MTPHKILLLLLAFCPISILAQTFEDTESKPNNRVYDAIQDKAFAYLCGVTTNSCNSTPFISKVSMETGSEVWNTATTTQVMYEHARSFAHLTVTEDAVYAINNRWIDMDILPELWKVNKTTGAIEWRVEISGGYEPGSKERIMDYSETYIIVAYADSFFIINKQDGSTYNSYSSKNLLGVGNNQELFLTGLGGIVKVLNFDFDHPVLLTNFPPPCCCASYSLERTEVLDDDHILVYGKRDCEGGTVWKLNHSTKELLWESHAAESSSVSIRESIVHNGFLYSVWQYQSVGSLTVSFNVSKVDLSSGQVVWTKKHLFDNPSYAQQIEYPRQANANSLTVDDSGDVYITGYANSQYLYGDFGIMKLKTHDGSIIYKKLISSNPAVFSKYNFGLKVMHHNDRIFCLGNLTQDFVDTFPLSSYPYPATSEIVLVEVDAASGETMRQNEYNGNKKESSGVIELKTLSDGVLKLENRGRHVYLSKIGKQNQVIWEHELKHLAYYGHRALEMQVNTAGHIAVLCSNISLSFRFDATTFHSHSGTLFIVDSQGATLQKLQVSTPVYYDLYCDGASFYTLTGSESNSYIYKANETGLIASNEFSMWLRSTPLSTRRLVDTNFNKLLVTGEYLNNLYIDKTTLQTEPTGLSFTSNKDFANDILIQEDTLFVAVSYASDPSRSYSTLVAYSLTTHSLLWNHTGSHSYGGYYLKMISDGRRYLYAIGVGQYQGLLIRKINFKTGAVLWSQNWTYANDLEPTDLFLDKVRNQLVITGNKLYNGTPTYVTVMVDEATGSTVSFNQHTDLAGTGITIAQLPEGDIMTGGYFTSASANCITNSVIKTYIPTRLSQSLTFDLINEIDFSTETITLSGSSTSGLPLSFETSDITISSVSGNTLKMHKTGTVVITALQEGNERYLPANPIEKILSINKLFQSITFPDFELKEKHDVPFTLDATSSAGLPITYTSSDPGVAEVTGSTVTIHKVGSALITAKQEGTDIFLPALEVTRELKIRRSTPSITFEPITAKKYGDPAFNLDATSTSALPVTFTSSDPSVVLIDGNEASILKSGAVVITANSSGNDDFETAEPVSQLLTITKSEQAITFDEMLTKTLGDRQFEFTAMSSSGLLLTYTSSDSEVVSIAGNTATILQAGQVIITASQEGDDRFYPASPVSRTLIINPLVTSVESSWGKWKLYPNPATHFIVIEGEQQVETIQVLDNIGRLLHTMDFERIVDISGWQSGIYYLRIVDINGTSIVKLAKL